MIMDILIVLATRSLKAMKDIKRNKVPERNTLCISQLATAGTVFICQLFFAIQTGFVLHLQEMRNKNITK